MMSLCDVIYHLCLCFQGHASEIGSRMMPYIVKLFNIADENQGNSIFSIIGKPDS